MSEDIQATTNQNVYSAVETRFGASSPGPWEYLFGGYGGGVGRRMGGAQRNPSLFMPQIVTVYYFVTLTH